MKLPQNLLVLAKGLLWLIAGLSSALLLISAITSQRAKTVGGVEYNLRHLSDGNDLITVQELKERILQTYDFDLVGVEAERLDLSDVERVLKDEAFIVDADAYLDANQNLHIDITQRTPVLRIMDLQGRNFYLDCEGVKLPLSHHFTARVPIASGVLNDYRIHIDSTGGSLGSAFEIAKAARNDDFVNSWLESIHFTSSGEIILNGNVGRFDVIFGGSKNIQEKFEKLKLFFKDGLRVTGWNEIESLDLTYAGQVITKSRAKT